MLCFCKTHLSLVGEMVVCVCSFFFSLSLYVCVCVYSLSQSIFQKDYCNTIAYVFHRIQYFVQSIICNLSGLQFLQSQFFLVGSDLLLLSIMANFKNVHSKQFFFSLFVGKHRHVWGATARSDITEIVLYCFALLCFFPNTEPICFVPHHEMDIFSPLCLFLFKVCFHVLSCIALSKTEQVFLFLLSCN